MSKRGYTEEPESLDPEEWRAYLARLDADPEAVPDYEAARRHAAQVIADLDAGAGRKQSTGQATRNLRDLLDN